MLTQTHNTKYEQRNSEAETIEDELANRLN